MKIIKLEAENVKRLKAITITPEGNLVVVGGENGEGKSSTLDSIAYALGGKDAICDEPLRRGAGKGKVVCELDDVVVTRTFTEKGGTLTVRDREGVKQTSPQTMLDALVGKLTFDPLAFSAMDPVKQRATLQDLLGVDFTGIDARREAAYASRTEHNRDAKKTRAQLDANPEAPPDTPSVEVSVMTLVDELKRRQGVNGENAVVRANVDQADQIAVGALNEVERLKEALGLARTRSDQAIARRDELVLATCNLEDQDEAEITTQIENAEQTNLDVRRKRVREALQGECSRDKLAAEAKTKEIEDCDRTKSEILSAIEYPVEGLALGDDGVTFNGLPFAQASSAEQLRVSVAMGLAMNPKLKVLLIRDGSLLDDKSLALVAQMAEEADAQVWLERVGKGQECSVVIEDGEVAR